MNLQELIRHILRMYEPCELEEALVAGVEPFIAREADRLSVLRSILTDPVNQLEVTKGGYYIYRFDLETMHRIADACGVPQGEPVAPVLRSYTAAEITQMIKGE